MLACQIKDLIQPMLPYTIGHNDLLDTSAVRPKSLQHWKHAVDRVRRRPLFRLRALISPFAVMVSPFRSHINCRRMREYRVNCSSFEVLSPTDRSSLHPTLCIPLDVFSDLLGQTRSSSGLFAAYESSNTESGNVSGSRSFSVAKFSTASSDIRAPRQEKSKPWGTIRNPCRSDAVKMSITPWSEEANFSSTCFVSLRFVFKVASDEDLKIAPTTINTTSSGSTMTDSSELNRSSSTESDPNLKPFNRLGGCW